MSEPLDRMRCARCGRYTLVDSDESVEWEVVGERDVCPGCITGGEEQAIFEDYVSDLPAEVLDPGAGTARASGTD